MGQPRQQAVLGILAMRANRVISRSELVDAVWGHDPPASAEGGIYTYVAGLRRIIEPNRSLRGPGRVLVSSGAGYVLHLVPGQPDAVSFEQYLGRARKLRKSGDPVGAVAALDSALGLWRGVAFAGVPGPFAETERARLGELRSTAAEERADVLLALGRHEEVVPDLTAMVAEHPLRERMRGLLMIALYRCGRQAESLRVFADGRRLLAEELGIDPCYDLARIHQQVLTSDAALNVAGAGDGGTQPRSAAPESPARGGFEAAAEGNPEAAEHDSTASAEHAPKAAAEGAAWPRDGRAAGPAITTPPPESAQPAPGHARPALDYAQTPDDAQTPGDDRDPAIPVPAQLPLEAPGFSGRQYELGELYAARPDPSTAKQEGADEPVPVVVISGTAGVGKTALAVRFGHQVARYFSDGQLYVNLHGVDPGAPVEPEVALLFFLDALGAPPHRIPSGTEGRAALYRSLLDGKQMLIVLDNARNAAQVRPLLPGSPGCLVVVTSRNQMAGLVAAEGAMPLTLDVLSHAEAREMLARRLGRDRVMPEPEAADEIISSCARLPLALAIAVGRAAGRRRRPLAELAAELRDARGRLDALEADDAATDVRAVLSWSYDQLSPTAARVFRLLGLHPGPDTSLSAAASLAGIPRAEAGAALRELTRTHMVAEHMPARFTFHDLLRAYAVDQAERHDSAYERRAAVHRVLDHYLHTAMAVSLRFSPHRSPLRLAAPQPGVLPAEAADKEQATAWFDAEVPVLLDLIAYADANGFDTHVWQISWTLGPFFLRRGRWREYAATQQVALAAARRLGDPVALGHSHYLLGHAQAQMGDYAAADPNVRQALEEFRKTRDRANEAMVLNGLSGMLEKQERYPEALAVALDALRMLKAAGLWWTQATLENGVGWLYAHLGQYDQALVHCQRALGLHRDSGHRGGAADTLDSLGYVYLHLADFEQAKAHYTMAVEAYREIGSPWGEGNSLAGLGDALLGEGSLSGAEAAWREAVAILDRLPHPLADKVRARLRALESRAAAGPVQAGPADPGHLAETVTTAR